MIDTTFNVKRYISVFDEQTELLVTEYQFSDFDLVAFQKEFNEIDRDNPMFDCYPITEVNVAFVESYLTESIKWDFQNDSYFVEADAL